MGRKLQMRVLLTYTGLMLMACSSTRISPTNALRLESLPIEVQKLYDFIDSCLEQKHPTNKSCFGATERNNDGLTKDDIYLVRSLMRDLIRDSRRQKRQASREGSRQSSTRPLSRAWTQTLRHALTPSRRVSTPSRPISTQQSRHASRGWGSRGRSLGRSRWNRGLLRIRKEVRRVSRYEWRNLVLAMQSLKRKGIYDRIAAVHRGFTRIDKAHFGPAFLGWHRIYLLVFENALRREITGVTIPYWDSSLDFHMTDPTRSIVWTEEFFGNGDGQVTTGPFVWRTGQDDDLTRNIGGDGTLISKDAISSVLNRYRHSEIMDETDTDRWMEGHHNGPHVWIDGHMGLLDSAPEDPVFWFHHSFVDHWWQLFRNQQMYRISIDPYNDYPDAQGDHNADSLMDPFNMTNRVGYHEYFYRQFYSYERSPSCSRRWPDCGSRYLRCNVTLQRCISIEGRTRISTNVNGRRGNEGVLRGGPGVLTSSADGAGVAPPGGVNQRPKPASKPVLRAGRRFTSPSTDPRTTGIKLRQRTI